MNFLKNTVKKYPEKKLEEAIQKMKYHISLKNEMESNLKTENDEKIKKNLKDRIDYQNELISIWENNIEKINMQLKKLE